MFSDGKWVFALLVYWAYRTEVQCKVHMERWDVNVLDVNASCACLEPTCLQLLSIHTLSGCDATSYPYGKGKITVLNNLFAMDYPGLVDVLSEGSITHAQYWGQQNTSALLFMISWHIPSWSLLAALSTPRRRTHLQPNVATNYCQHVSASVSGSSTGHAMESCKLSNPHW